MAHREDSSAIQHSAPRASGLGLLCAAAWLAAGCSQLRLVPVTPTDGSRATATADNQGVSVMVDSEPQNRPWPLPHGVTSLRLSIRNSSGHPIVVDLDDIRLRGATRELSALPPDSISPRRRVDSLGMSPTSPLLGQQTSAARGGRPGSSETLTFEPGFQATFYDHPRRARDPERQAILLDAFSGGSIANGNTLSGLVYFEGVPIETGSLRLRIGVRSYDGASPSVLEILYAVRG